jgi:hypothetical protein
MLSRELGRRPLASVNRGRKIFNHRKRSRSRPFLVASTVAVGVALVFTIGFKLGRTYQTESVAAVDPAVAAVPGAVARNEPLNQK